MLVQRKRRAGLVAMDDGQGAVAKVPYVCSGEMEHGENKNAAIPVFVLQRALKW